eukprot:scaffold6984_cov47-Attheya_sp.AAC.2
MRTLFAMLGFSFIIDTSLATLEGIWNSGSSSLLVLTKYVENNCNASTCGAVSGSPPIVFRIPDSTLAVLQSYCRPRLPVSLLYDAVTKLLYVALFYTQSMQFLQNRHERTGFEPPR